MIEVKNLHMQELESSCLVLGNAFELLMGVVSEVAGNDVSSSINGSPITQSVVVGIAQPIFQKAIKEQL